jgi:hypothetical protein
MKFLDCTRHVQAIKNSLSAMYLGINRLLDSGHGKP